MRHTRPLLGAILALALGLSSCQPQTGISSRDARDAVACIEPDAIRAHIRFLSDDLLEGREAGTRGFQLAAKYVASTFETMGLEPAGIDGTYFQNVPLRSSALDLEQSSLTLIRDGWKKQFQIGEDYVLRPDFQRESVRVRAPLIFVGFGITAPELNHDDYAGLEVGGKIAVMIFGAPATFPNSQRAYYSGRPKVENALAHGALGILTILSPADAERIPWAAVAASTKKLSMGWIDSSGRPSAFWPEIRGRGLLGQEIAEEIFSHASTPLAELFSGADDETPHGFDIPIEVEIVTVSRLGEVQSPNVVAKLEGTDPELRDEYLVYSAHLDHDGVMESKDGDNIFNGAYDNAAGTAVLLELARAFKCLSETPKRSVLFLGTTAGRERSPGRRLFRSSPHCAARFDGGESQRGQSPHAVPNSGHRRFWCRALEPGRDVSAGRGFIWIFRSAPIPCRRKSFSSVAINFHSCAKAFQPLSRWSVSNREISRSTGRLPPEPG